MGQTQSNPKLSGEITLNRIRDTCQYDPSIPREIRDFKIEALANDLNVFGMDIAVVDKSGKRKPALELCNEIKERALPRVEDVCMANPHLKGEMGKILEHLVRHFNTFYGARISLYRNPLDPSQGRRSYSDVCDDLYLVSDKLYRRLNDQPAVIKSKLAEQLKQLELRKVHLDQIFNSSLINLDGARQRSKLQDKMTATRNMYMVTKQMLNQDYETAKQAFLEVVRHINTGVDDSFNQIRAKLAEYKQSRGEGFTNQMNALLGIVSSLPQGLYTCQSCLNRFGMTVDQLNALKGQPYPVFSSEMERKVKELAKMYPTEQGLGELLKCYKQLVQDGVQCQDRNSPAPSTLFNFTPSNVGMMGGDIIGPLSNPANVAKVVIGNLTGTLPREYQLQSYQGTIANANVEQVNVQPEKKEETPAKSA